MSDPLEESNEESQRLQGPELLGTSEVPVLFTGFGAHSSRQGDVAANITAITDAQPQALPNFGG